MAAPNAYVALMRGINVGGKNKLAMKDLVAIFEDAGGRDVVTYIQSGNVVFRATDAQAARVPARVAKVIASRFGYETPVVLRSASEVAAVAAKNPFLRAGAPPEALHVMFLADAPPAAAVASLDPSRSPPDAFEVRGREIFLHCPNGVGRTKLTNAWFDAKLRTVSTARNWKTVLELVRLSGG